MTELRDIPGYEGLYAVTRDGRVWFHGRQTYYKDGRPHRYYNPRWMAPITHTGGYLTVRLRDSEGKQTTRLIHRLVAMAYIPNPDNLPEVNHKDSNRANPNDWNLEWVTPQGNTHHAMIHGNLKPKTTGFYGVSIHPNGFQVKASLHGKQRAVGYRKTPEEAAHLYDVFVRQHNLDLPLNFPV